MTDFNHTVSETARDLLFTIGLVYLPICQGTAAHPLTKDAAISTRSQSKANGMYSYQYRTEHPSTHSGIEHCSTACTAASRSSEQIPAVPRTGLPAQQGLPPGQLRPRKHPLLEQHPTVQQAQPPLPEAQPIQHHWTLLEQHRAQHQRLLHRAEDPHTCLTRSNMHPCLPSGQGKQPAETDFVPPYMTLYRLTCFF